MQVFQILYRSVVEGKARSAHIHKHYLLFGLHGCFPIKGLDIKPDFKLETGRDSSSVTDSDNRTDWSPILFGIIRVINKIG